MTGPLLSAIAALVFNVGGTVVAGPVRVVDGDTLIVAGTVVRLKGVDAAELGTTRGENAKRVMITLVGSELSCRLTGEKTHGREVGYCVTAAGVDVNQQIIALGAALACPRYDPKYLQFERAEALVLLTRAPYCIAR